MSMEIPILIITLAIIACIVILIILNNSDKKAKMKKIEELKQSLIAKGVIISKEIIYKDLNFIVDDTAKRWYVYEMPSDEILFRSHTYQDILEYELWENGNSISNGSTSGAIVGGLLFGAAGAIAGSTLTKSKECDELYVRVTVNDIKNPQVVIKLIANTTDKSSDTYKQAIEAAKEMCSTLTYMINNK